MNEEVKYNNMGESGDSCLKEQCHDEVQGSDPVVCGEMGSVSSGSGDANCSRNKMEHHDDGSDGDDDNGDDVENEDIFDKKQNLFTSEIFKIEVRNLPRHFGLGVLRKRIRSLKLDPVKVKGTGNKSNYVYVTFRNDEDRKKALEVLDGHKWKGCVLKAKYASACEDPIARKRKEESCPGFTASKKQKIEQDLPLEERLKNVVAPLWAVPYESQLKKKQEDMVVFMKRLTKEIDKQNKDARKWLAESRKLNSDLCCPLEDVKPSPVLENYRNKCEFTIGVSDDDDQVKTVGFRLSSYKSGTTCVAPPGNSLIVSTEMCAVVQCFQDYIQQSTYDVYSPQTYSGHWKLLTVRISKKGDIMAIVGFDPQDLSPEALAEEKNKLRDYFSKGQGTTCKVTSLYFHSQTNRAMGGQSEHPVEWLWGDQYVCEQLLSLNFRISPDAFFQTNTLGAEVLYTTIAEWSQVSMDTHILDVCCGTGTIGLTMAKNVEKVIGIEMSQQAIDDAKHNAELNGVTNATYHCGKAEDVLPRLMYSLTDKNVLAIVDPPRPGLHNKVVYAIRKCPYINRLLYVSCNPQGAFNNLVDFMRAPSKRVKGPPFRPVKAVPVDMFPHTKHCELVILMERQCQDK